MEPATFDGYRAEGSYASHDLYSVARGGLTQAHKMTWKTCVRSWWVSILFMVLNLFSGSIPIISTICHAVFYSFMYHRIKGDDVSTAFHHAFDNILSGRRVLLLVIIYCIQTALQVLVSATLYTIILAPILFLFSFLTFFVEAAASLRPLEAGDDLVEDVKNTYRISFLAIRLECCKSFCGFIQVGLVALLGVFCTVLCLLPFVLLSGGLSDWWSGNSKPVSWWEKAGEVTFLAMIPLAQIFISAMILISTPYIYCFISILFLQTCENQGLSLDDMAQPPSSLWNSRRGQYAPVSVHEDGYPVALDDEAGGGYKPPRTF